MRATPFKSNNTAATTLAEPEANTPAVDAYKGDPIDLSDLLSRRPTTLSDIQEPTPAAEQPKTPTPDPKPTPTTPQADENENAEFEEEDTTEEEPAAEPVKPMIDPTGFAETIIDIANLGRQWFYPGLYDKIVFDEYQREDLRGAQKKRAIANRQGGEADLTEYEKSLLKTHTDLTAAKLKISYTKEEKKLLASKLARQLETIDFVKKMEKYDWALVILAIEGMRFMELKKLKNQTSDAKE